MSTLKDPVNNGGRIICGIEFAPLNVPWKRRMETLGAAQMLFTTFLSGPLSYFFLTYLFFCTKYYYIPIAYTFWYYYDWNTSDRGGRRCSWIRKLKIWKHYCDYFPLKLVKTCELDPKENYLLTYHPHGVICMGAVGNFATEGTNFSQVFPGITPHLLTLPGHFSFPLYREYLMGTGMCPSSRASMNFLLSRPEGGHAAILVPGGALESLDARPGKFTKLHLKYRKGFIKVALQNGASLVPTYSFGETSVYDQVDNPEGSVIRQWQIKFQKIFGLAPALVSGRGFFQYSFGLLPHRRPITTVVGKPIKVDKKLEPTQEEIDELHSTYVSELLQLFDTYKSVYANKDEVLEIV